MSAPQLGLRANAAQFTLLVGLNALVGAMVGLERSVLPLVGEADFGLRSSTAILAFVVGYASIAWLLRYVAHHTLMPFVVYRVALGAVVLTLAATGTIS